MHYLDGLGMVLLAGAGLIITIDVAWEPVVELKNRIVAKFAR